MTLFAEQLKKLRQEKNISQEDLAQELFISRQAISKWENGAATPDLENLVKLSEILTVSLDELVKGEKRSSDNQEDDDDNLHLLRGREYVINPETGKYEKRDGLAIFIDLISEYWWGIFFVPLFVMWIKILIDLF
ncbi:helix-turn-helix domain-containing protein [Streptococcus hillyeri]|uniref:Helix-turn-helix domain-containing protein n=1 Tax=Streptococcus hillyeri TaxID=2282420 RepID=A0A3L9DWC0_9STRE|nr:helix-turn-helix domain-containing protein [Streptococcus hillyeri]RLY03462.1 helix-turn-helix domain-containing protein [Streptococcus hillyeri]